MSDRFYKIGNTWYPWQTAHGLYGYTKTPTIRITYISTSQATWGQPESGYGFFDGDASEPQDGSYFHTSTWGWFDADTMAKTIRLMPSECEIDDIFFENDGDISPGARLIIDPNVSIDEEDWRYLIASVRNLGWHTLDEWESLGWVLTDPNTLYFGGDFSGNNIRMESVDGGGGLIEKFASYKALFDLRGWEPGGLFIDKPRMMGICGVLTETSDSVVLVEVAKQLSVGRIEFSGSLAEGGIPESGVVEEYIPAPVLPTVGNPYKLFFNSSGRGDYSFAADVIKNLYSSAGYTNSYDSTKSYSITGCYNSYGNVVIRTLPVVNNNNLMAVENKSGSTLTVSYVFICECSSNQAEVVTVFNASDEAFNAFKFTANSTDYYYVLDDVQTDWTDDLSSIGYIKSTTYTNPVTNYVSAKWRGNATSDPNYSNYFSDINGSSIGPYYTTGTYMNKFYLDIPDDDYVSDTITGVTVGTRYFARASSSSSITDSTQGILILNKDSGGWYVILSFYFSDISDGNYALDGSITLYEKPAPATLTAYFNPGQGNDTMSVTNSWSTSGDQYEVLYPLNSSSTIPYDSTKTYMVKSILFADGREVTDAEVSPHTVGQYITISDLNYAGQHMGFLMLRTRNGNVVTGTPSGCRYTEE